MDIKNKVAIITGSSRGIGFAIARELLKNGAKHVVNLDINESEGNSAVKQFDDEFGKGKSSYHHCDVTNTDELKKIFENVAQTYKTVDILVNNAGIGDENYPERMVDINVKAVLVGNLIAIEHMGKHKGGKGGTIVNIASGLGLMHSPVYPIYAATKHAVVSYTRCMKDHNDVLGIRIMAMCPGWTQTTMADGNLISSVEDIVTKEQMDAIPRKMQPASRVGFAVCEMILKGQNGAVWVSANNQAYFVEEPPTGIKEMHPVYPELKYP